MPIVKPHNLISRDVTPEDHKRIHECVIEMFKLCYVRHGDHYYGGAAVAHAQIDDKDPLRFFVTREGELILNPIITRHVRHTSTKEEGCLSFPDREVTKVERWHKCEVTYQLLKEGGEVKDMVESLVGVRA